MGGVALGVGVVVIVVEPIIRLVIVVLNLSKYDPFTFDKLYGVKR